MIEIKSLTHIQRLFAEKTSWNDIIKPVYYAGYRGDKKNIPWWYSKHFGCSCETDLNQSMESIFASMKSGNRNEIRRAEKEGCVVEYGVPFDVFIPFYNDFCERKGLHDKVDKDRLAKYKSLIISAVKKDNIYLSMHAILMDRESGISLFLLSGSPRLNENVDKKLIGWGNKYLHYKDLEYLKKKGYRIFDWSGVCMDPADSRYTIGQFKLSFGGALTENIVLKTPLFKLLELPRLLFR